MRAIGIMEFGDPEVLRPVDLPEVDAGPGEVRLRVRAATVNPTDIVLRSGGRAERLRNVAPPHVPGMEVAGVVDQIGDGSETDLRRGDRAMAIVVPLGRHGGYSERVVVPAASVAASPANSTDAEAATIPMNGLTVRLALDELGLERGQTLAVTGAAGAVGGYAVELGRVAGLQVIADAAPNDEPIIRGFGADVVVPRGVDFARHVRDVVPDGVDGLIDAALLNAEVLPAVRDEGRVVSLRGFDGGDAVARGIEVVPIFVRNYATQQQKLDDLGRLVEASALTPRVARTMPASEAAQAHRMLESGGQRGRLVLEF